MHSGFDDLDDLIDEDPEDDPPPSTARTKGSATFEVEDRMEALFISATWQLIARVKNDRGEIVIAQSTTSQRSHTAPFTKRWARQVIRSNKKKLRHKGVDVEAAYLGWGGRLEDLEDA